MKSREHPTAKVSSESTALLHDVMKTKGNTLFRLFREYVCAKVVLPAIDPATSFSSEAAPHIEAPLPEALHCLVMRQLSVGLMTKQREQMDKNSLCAQSVGQGSPMICSNLEVGCICQKVVFF